MRPYLAIIKDSFREALASRVLWVLLALITLALLVIAPLSYTQQLTTGLREGDVDEWPELVDKLKEGESLTADRPLRHIWGLLDESERQKLRNFRRIKQRPNLREVNEFQKSVREVQAAISDLLKHRDFYDSAAWSGTRLSFEGQQLARRLKELDEEEVGRLNRIALEAALPGIVEVSPPTSFQLYYALYGNIGQPLPLSKKQLANGFRAGLPWFIDKILLSIGLLVAVIVTAPIIPQTFDPGSLHLLLSKPIFRWLLYVTKFVGGCAFVLLAAGYLFVGMWLLLGWRMGVWEARLLWCIPIYAFVFATYYSVAALAGLFWRNTVVSIMVAIVFWGVCFGIGVAKSTLGSMVEKTRIKQIVLAGDDMLAVDNANTPLAWNTSQNRWDAVFLSDEVAELRSFITAVAQMPPMHGPVYDRRSKQLAAVTVSFRNGQRMISSGSRAKNWKQVEGPPSPAAPLALLSEPDGAPLLVTSDGFYRLGEDLQPAGAPVKFLGFSIPLRSRGPLQDAGPTPRQSWPTPAAAAMSATDGKIAIYSRGTLLTYDLESNGQYRKLGEQKLPGNDDERVRLAFTGNAILVARGDATVQIVASGSLNVRSTVEMPDKQPVVSVAASPNGRTFALVLEDMRLVLLENPQGNAGHWLAKVRGQGDISAATFDAQGKLLVVDRTARLSRYSIAPPTREKQWTPPMALEERIYRYVVEPLYWLCPKPGEFYKTVQYLLLSQDDGEADAPISSGSLQTQLQPWAPVWSSLAFMLVLLAAGSVYMQRQEF